MGVLYYYTGYEQTAQTFLTLSIAIFHKVIYKIHQFVEVLKKKKKNWTTAASQTFITRLRTEIFSGSQLKVLVARAIINTEEASKKVIVKKSERGAEWKTKIPRDTLQRVKFAQSCLVPHLIRLTS